MATVVPHIPLLRLGNVYESLETLDVVDHRSGETLATVSQAIPGMIKKDHKKIVQFKNPYTLIELQRICKRAAEIFMSEALPVGSGIYHDPDDYARYLSATSGMPVSMCHDNMKKVYHVMAHITEVIDGLTRGVSLEVIQDKYGMQGHVPVSYFKVANTLGAVLPSNSPGVNSLWIPSLVLDVPVLVKPGREEPWTPFRIMQSFLKAGLPKEMVNFYPTNHEGARRILEECDRALLFGDSQTTNPYKNNVNIEIHGPGYSKVYIAEDKIDQWQEHLDMLYDSVMDNGGRSCINTSSIIVPRHGREIAHALAKRMVQMTAKSHDDPEAILSSSANQAMVEWVNNSITQDLKVEGAEELTALYRDSERCIQLNEATFMLPTLIYCESVDHPACFKEFMFPFVTVVEMNQETVIEDMGDTLVATIVTDDDQLIEQALMAENIDRLNLGSLKTSKVEWNQPHEGNLFEFLYKRRALQYEPKVLKRQVLDFSSSPNVNVVHGVHSVDTLPHVLSEIKPASVLIVTDEGLVTAGHIGYVKELLERHHYRVNVFADVQENPTTEDVNACVAFAKQHGVDCLIGLGGGSSLDTAKGSNFILSCGGEMKDYKGIGQSDKEFLPFIAIPTTAGTGSECQSFALIIDHETHMKMPCGDKKAVAHTVILDPMLTLTQPENVTTCTAIDALVHAVETSVTSKRNDVSRTYSFESFKLIVNNLPKVLKDPNDVVSRGQMQLAAAYAGVAIENSMLGGAHATANPLTAHNNLIHGIAVGVMLPHVMRFNRKDSDVENIYHQLAVYSGIATERDTVTRSVDQLIACCENLLRLSRIPTNLIDCDVNPDVIDQLAEEATQQWTGTFNPVPLNQQDFYELYRRAFEKQESHTTT